MQLLTDYGWNLTLLCPLRAKESNCVQGFKKQNAIRSKATKCSRPIMHATIGKTYDLVALVMNSMFKYDYLS